MARLCNKKIQGKKGKTEKERSVVQSDQTYHRSANLSTEEPGNTFFIFYDETPQFN